MSRLLEWNTLQEAADYLALKLKEELIPRQVLDASLKGPFPEDGFGFKVNCVLPPEVGRLIERNTE